MAQDDDLGSPLVVRTSQNTADRRVDAERGEVGAIDGIGGKHFSRARGADRQLDSGRGGQVGERSLGGTQVAEVRVGYRPLHQTAIERRDDEGDPSGVVDAKILQKDPVHHRVEGGRDADPDRQRQNREYGEEGGRRQPPSRESQVDDCRGRLSVAA